MRVYIEYMKSPFGKIFADQNINQDQMKYKLSNDYVNVYIEDKPRRLRTGTVVGTLDAFARTVQEQTTEELGLITIKGYAELLFLSTYPLEFRKKKLLYDKLLSDVRETSELDSVEDKILGISKIIATIIGEEKITLYVDIVDDDEIRDVFTESDRYDIANNNEHSIMLTRDISESELDFFENERLFETVPETIPVLPNSKTTGIAVTVYFDSDEELVTTNRTVQHGFGNPE